MKVNLITVNLENDPDRLFLLIDRFTEKRVNIRMLNLENQSGLGVAVLLVNDLKSARRVLMESHVPAGVEEALAFTLPDKTGQLSAILRPVIKEKIAVKTLYAISGGPGRDAVVVARFSNNDKALHLLSASGFDMEQPVVFLSEEV